MDARKGKGRSNWRVSEKSRLRQARKAVNGDDASLVVDHHRVAVRERLARRRRELKRRKTLALALGGKHLFDGHEVLRGRRLVATQDSELLGRFVEEGVALRALGASEAFCTARCSLVSSVAADQSIRQG